MKWNILEYIPALSVTQSRMFCCTELHHWVDFSRPFFKLFPSFPFSFMLSGQAPLPLGWSSHTVWVCSSAHSEVHKLFVTQEARTLEGEIVSVCVKSIWTMYEKRPYSSREWHWFSMTREGAVTLEAHFDKKHTHTHSWGWQGVCLGCLVRSAMHYCLRSPLRSTSCLPRKERRERILSPPTHTHKRIPHFIVPSGGKGRFCIGLNRAAVSSFFQLHLTHTQAYLHGNGIIKEKGVMVERLTMLLPTSLSKLKELFQSLLANLFLTGYI